MTKMSHRFGPHWWFTGVEGRSSESLRNYGSESNVFVVSMDAMVLECIECITLNERQIDRQVGRVTLTRI